MAARPVSPAQQRARRLTALACLSVVLGMVGVAFAAVPLYDLFCRVTGYDGTPLVRATAADAVLDRRITVRFDTNVAPGLRWSFSPELREVETRLGATETVFFRVRNDGPSAAKGIATFNVQPGQAGQFFVKMKCFCFDEQTIAPGETIDFPVVFYVEPTLAKDKTLAALSSITLSYTYFASRNGQPVASLEAGAPRSN